MMNIRDRLRKVKLGPRHQRVANEVLRGGTQREIARELGYSVRTVETYIRQIAAAITPADDTRRIPPMRRILLSFEAFTSGGGACLA